MQLAVDRSLKEPRVPYDIEYLVVRIDDTERIIHKRSKVALNENGKPIRVVGTVQAQDITDRIKTEKELQHTLHGIQNLKAKIEAENLCLQKEIRQEN